MNTLTRSEALLASLQVILISLLVAGPVAGLWFNVGSAEWFALALLPAAVTLLSLGSQTWRMPATLRPRFRPTFPGLTPATGQ